MKLEDKKIAIVTDWLTNYRGGERVVLAMKQAFPESDIITSVYNPDGFPKEFREVVGEVKTTWIQKLPKKLRNFHQLFPVVRAFTFRRLDLRDYDLVISVTSAEAKQVRRLKFGARHICYCHTPTRYYWSHYEQYKKDPGFGKLNWLVRIIMAPMVALMRRLDYSAASRPEIEFIANSSVVKKRIKKYYNRDSVVIYPPTDIDEIKYNDEIKNRDGYLVLGAQVPYKRADLAVMACIKLGVMLTLVGDGSEHERLKKLSSGDPNIIFKTNISDAEKIELLGSFKAQIFPQYEDFGITAIECMAAGTPVLAYRKGGALDTVAERKSGMFFDRQNVRNLAKLIKKVEDGSVVFDPAKVRAQALKFSKTRFTKDMLELVEK